MEERDMALKKWLSIIQESRRSNLSIREWCKKNDVRYTSYYYWYGLLRDRGMIAPLNAEVKKPLAVAEAAPVIAQIQFSEEPASYKEEVPLVPQVMIMRNSYQVYVGKDFDDSTLKRVLEVVGQC